MKLDVEKRAATTHSTTRIFFPLLRQHKRQEINMHAAHLPSPVCWCLWMNLEFLFLSDNGVNWQRLERNR
ncbi:hypothetical protein LEMLEM_LOCUS15895, partial [Lemmus lemmus]